MNPRHAVGACLLAALMAACGPSPPSAGMGSDRGKQAQAPSTTDVRERKTTQMTTLSGLLAVFVSDAGTRWAAYDGAAGVTWREALPEDNPDVADPAQRCTRSGRIVLAGFGEADLPDGADGADAGVRRGNAGESGLTLSGDADRVNGIAVVKFYPDGDYARILADQFAPGTAIAAIADDCAFDPDTREENTGANAFFRVDLGGRDVFVEGFVDADDGARGPGTTTFVFYRSRPDARIAAMACRVR